MANNVMNMDGSFKPFRAWCQHVLPLVYDDSLSYMELLNKVIVYINSFGEYLEEFSVINRIEYAGIWDITKNYKINSVVSDHGYGYLSMKAVPAGIPIEATDYWLKIADFAGELIDLGNRVLVLEGKMDTAEDDIDTLQSAMSVAQSDITSISGRVTVTEANITALQNTTKELVKNGFNTGKTLFIGDSWGGCWNHPHGTGTIFYQDVIAQKLGITNYWKYYEGGTGFAYADGHWYGKLLEDFVADHPDETNNITNIFIIGGQNDLPNVNVDYVHSNTQYEGKWCANYIATHYPNAKVWVGMVARTCMYNTAGAYGNIVGTIRKYQELCRENNWNYIVNSHYMVHDYSMISEDDGRHLTHAGYERLGLYLAESIKNGYWANDCRGYADVVIRPANETTGTLLGDGVTNCNIKQFISPGGVTLLLDEPYFLDFTAKNREAEKIYVLNKYGSSPSDINYHPANLFSSLYRIKIPVGIILISNNGTLATKMNAVIRLHEDGQMALQFFDTNAAGNAWVNFLACTRVVIEPFSYTIPLDLC